MTNKILELCPICNIELSDKNTARKSWENNEVRFDAFGKAWCQKCASKHDSIDWGEGEE